MGEDFSPMYIRIVARANAIESDVQMAQAGRIEIVDLLGEDDSVRGDVRAHAAKCYAFHHFG